MNKTMIKVEDLRIGDLIFDNERKKIIRVTKNTLVVASRKFFTKYCFLPITDDRILTFNFKTTEFFGTYVHAKLQGWKLTCDANGAWFFYCGKAEAAIHVRYMHEVQNFYKLIVKEELK